MSDVTLATYCCPKDIRKLYMPGMVYYINCIRGRNMDYMVMTHDVYAEVGQYLQIKTYHWMDD